MTQELHSRLTRRRALAALFASGSFCLGGRTGAQSDQTQRAPPMRKRNPKALGVARNPVWLSLPPTPNIPSPMRSELAPVNGISIYFAQFGDAGPPLLLLHGGLGNSNYWGHQITELAKRFSVTVDGYPRSRTKSIDLARLQLRLVCAGRRGSAGLSANPRGSGRRLERRGDHRAAARDSQAGSHLKALRLRRQQHARRAQAGWVCKALCVPTAWIAVEPCRRTVALVAPL